MPERLTTEEATSESAGGGSRKTLKQAQKRLRDVKECGPEKDYRKKADEDLDYFTGKDQGWDKDGARARLEGQKRPAITLNRVQPIIRLIEGARPQSEARYIAVEQGDLETASTLNACKDHIDAINMWEHREREWFRNGMVNLRSVVGIFPTYDHDIRGDVALSVEDGRKFWFDPNAKAKDRRDGEWLFKIERVTTSAAKRMFPNKKAAINELVAGVETESPEGATTSQSKRVEDYEDIKSNYYDPTTGLLAIVYYWYKEFHNQTKIIDLEGLKMAGPEATIDSFVFDSSKTKAEAQKIIDQDPYMAARFKVVEVEYTDVKYMTFSHEIIFEEGETPWQREDGRRTFLSESIPYLAFEPDRIHAGLRSELISLIDPLKDPQTYHNKLASAILATIGTVAHSGWEYEKGAISNAEKQKLKKYGSTPGIHIEWEKGALTQGRARKIQPNMPPQAQMAVAKQMADDLLNISGVESLVSTEQLGKGASGVAIDLKQRQGGNIISWVYDSFRFFQHVLCMFERDSIQRLYDYEKVIRIKGSKPRYVVINETIYDEYGAITEVLNDVTSGQYDVTITDKEVLPSMRLERFREFAALVKEGALQLPPQVLSNVVLELMDDPDLKQLVEDELAEFERAMQAQMAANPMGGGMPMPAQQVM